MPGTAASVAVLLAAQNCETFEASQLREPVPCAHMFCVYSIPAFPYGEVMQQDIHYNQTQINGGSAGELTA